MKLKPLMVPNFAIVQLSPPSNAASASETGPSIPLRELDADALEELAYGFLIEFYKKAGKQCPFYRPAKAA
jgi:hypothetical protein